MQFVTLVLSVLPVLCSKHEVSASTCSSSPTIACPEDSVTPAPAIVVHIEADSGTTDGGLHGSAIVTLEEDTSASIQPSLTQGEPTGPRSTTGSNPTPSIHDPPFNYPWGLATAGSVSGVSRLSFSNATSSQPFPFSSAATNARQPSSMYPTASAGLGPGFHTPFVGSGSRRMEFTSHSATFLVGILPAVGLLFT